MKVFKMLTVIPFYIFQFNLKIKTNQYIGNKLISIIIIYMYVIVVDLKSTFYIRTKREMIIFIFVCTPKNIMYNCIEIYFTQMVLSQYCI